VRQSKEMDWEQKQKITEQLNKAKQIEESLQNIQNKIETNISRMKKNDIISPETLQKYFDLQEMFQKLLDSEFLEKMRKMEEMLNNKSSKELQKLMKQSDFSVKEFEEQIERIYELFRKVELERKLDELVQLNKKINKEQENNFNEFVNKNDQNNVNERQKQIAKDEQFLQKSMDELSKSLEEKESSLKQGLTEVDEFQKKNEILKKIQEMQESAQQKNKSDFQENHSQTMPLLQERLQKLEQLKQDFVKQEKNDTKNKINFIIEEMLSLSKQQENLNQSFKSISRYSSKIEELAVNQMNLNKFLLFEINKIVKLSHETFFLPMLLNQPLSKAQINMKKVISTLEERRTYQLTRQLDEIIKNINKAIFLLLQTQNSIEQSQSGTGIEQFMQQMQQMAGLQSGVNKQTMQMFQNGKHGQMPGQSDPQALVKLAAQQQAIQRSMDKLGESMTEGAGRGKSQIEKMAEEMKEIVKDLQRRKIDRKTINRQEKILSRMLDASRSIHKKDQSEKRKAEIAGEYIINVPDKIGNIIFYKNKIYEEYERALEQDLSPELKKMLKEYYDELLGKAKYQ
ncbi:MAG: hypothetical protein KAR38_13315, partial [Calditrichia bacterium]|nr:hypothetical protein [Calditrichia bacterium]